MSRGSRHSAVESTPFRRGIRRRVFDSFRCQVPVSLMRNEKRMTPSAAGESPPHCPCPFIQQLALSHVARHTPHTPHKQGPGDLQCNNGKGQPITRRAGHAGVCPWAKLVPGVKRPLAASLSCCCIIPVRTYQVPGTRYIFSLVHIIIIGYRTDFVTYVNPSCCCRPWMGITQVRESPTYLLH